MISPSPVLEVDNEYRYYSEKVYPDIIKMGIIMPWFEEFKYSQLDPTILLNDRIS